jgi:hypothetical protein
VISQNTISRFFTGVWVTVEDRCRAHFRIGISGVRDSQGKFHSTMKTLKSQREVIRLQSYGKWSYGPLYSQEGLASINVHWESKDQESRGLAHRDTEKCETPTGLKAVVL